MWGATRAHSAFVRSLAWSEPRRASRLAFASSRCFSVQAMTNLPDQPSIQRMEEGPASAHDRIGSKIGPANLSTLSSIPILASKADTQRAAAVNLLSTLDLGAHLGIARAVRHL